MHKYYVLFRIPIASIDDWMKNVSAAERKTQSDDVMQKWKEWAEEHADAIVDAGSPLGKTKTVTKDGIADSRNDLNYVMIIQADSHDAAAELIASNPHVQMIPTSSADVIDIPHMGM